MAKIFTEKRFPTWLLLVTGLFILFVVAGLLVIMFQDLPAEAQPEMLEQEFAEHLAFFKELALACPDIGMPPLPDSSGEEDTSAWKEYTAAWKAWSEMAESRRDLLDHPALLGASVYILNSEGGTKVRNIIKEFEDLESSWLDQVLGSLSRGSGEPGLGRPSVRHWQAGNKHVVQYENLFIDSSGEKIGCQLLFDLDQLGRKKTSSEP